MGDKPFKLDWMSVYKFRCAKLDQFVHNRVIFVGDSAAVSSARLAPAVAMAAFKTSTTLAGNWLQFEGRCPC